MRLAEEKKAAEEEAKAAKEAEEVKAAEEAKALVEANAKAKREAEEEAAAAEAEAKRIADIEAATLAAAAAAVAAAAKVKADAIALALKEQERLEAEAQEADIILEELKQAESKQAEVNSLSTVTVVKPQSHRGIMLKEGQVFKTWKKRYFVLEEGVLSYYPNEADSKSVANRIGEALSLKGYVVSRGTPAKTRLLLSTQGTDRNLLLEVPDSSELAQWEVAFKAHILYLGVIAK